MTGSRHLLHDRDPLLAERFRKILKPFGVKAVKISARRSPNLNAYPELFVRSVNSECLAKIIPLGEGHLRHVEKNYTAHYHFERSHQGLDNKLIEKPIDGSYMDGAIDHQERAGVVLSYQHWRAARWWPDLWHRAGILFW